MSKMANGMLMKARLTGRGGIATPEQSGRGNHCCYEKQMLVSKEGNMLLKTMRLFIKKTGN